MDVQVKDRVRQVVVVVSVVLAIVGSAIGSGAFGGTAIQDAAGGALAADATLLAPGTGAFQIWSAVYLGLVAYAVLQALPTQATRDRHRRIGWLAAASMLLNAAWILSIQAGLLALSVSVIAALVVVLVLIVLRLGRAESTVDRIVGDGTFGLYLGWVTIATVANVTALLQQAGLGWVAPLSTSRLGRYWMQFQATARCSILTSAFCDRLPAAGSVVLAERGTYTYII